MRLHKSDHDFLFRRSLMNAFYTPGPSNSESFGYYHDVMTSLRCLHTRIPSSLTVAIRKLYASLYSYPYLMQVFYQTNQSPPHPRSLTGIVQNISKHHDLSA
jgi:hypothetical protein